jgi:hypothetical protein
LPASGDFERISSEGETVERREAKKEIAPVTAKRRGILARDSTISSLLFLFLLFVYTINGDVLPSNDAVPNVYLPLNLLKGGGLAFTPRDWPFMFTTRSDSPGGAAAPLNVPSPVFYLVRSIRTDPITGDIRFVNAFGIGSGLTALPFIAPLQLVLGDAAGYPWVLWYGAKLAASLLVAGTAALAYWIARGFLERRLSLLVATSYGLGTSAWSTSSQTLWQHGPNEFFLMLGTFLFLKRTRSRWYAAAATFAYGWAVFCRPTSALVVVAIGIYLLMTDRETLLIVCLAGLPLALALAAYNTYYLGSPLRFGQTELAKTLAIRKTGFPGTWQTPLWLGATGQLFSPSRGLLVFSPFLGFACGGAYLAWRRQDFADLRPLSLAVLLMLLVEFKHFDWWGGWSYGYRHIVDPAALMVILLIPIIPWVGRDRLRFTVYLVLLSWSIFVQFIGAFAYDPIGWNNRLDGYILMVPGRAGLFHVQDRTVFVRSRDLALAESLIRDSGARFIREVRLDIDDRENRHRLWSFVDNEMFYHVRNFSQSRHMKHIQMREQIGDVVNPSRTTTGGPKDSK